MGGQIWRFALSSSCMVFRRRAWKPLDKIRCLGDGTSKRLGRSYRGKGYVQTFPLADMKHGTKWFSSALTMAFLAIVALFVSPALAWSCCCSSQSVASSLIASRKADSRPSTLPSHCIRPCCAHEDERVTSVGAASSHRRDHVAVVKAKCHCSHDADTPAVIGVSSHSFFAHIALAMPIRALVVSSVEDVRTLPCFVGVTRPRSPGRRSSCGRGPPVFSS